MRHTCAYFPFALWIEASKNVPYHNKFLVRSCEMWRQMKEPRMGHTLMYFPFGALSLVPQIAAYQ